MAIIKTLDIRVRIVGAGGPRRLKTLGLIAKLFRINLTAEGEELNPFKNKKSGV